MEISERHPNSCIPYWSLAPCSAFYNLIVVFSDGANGRVCEGVHNGGQAKGNTVYIIYSNKCFHLREGYSFLKMKINQSINQWLKILMSPTKQLAQTELVRQYTRNYACLEHALKAIRVG